ncbi:MAG: SCO family protein [Candidatus Marinimicrobia bacterium]|nr:SCO family protein [Candidatus Neomarinimicrobiota bacterium]
MESRFSKDIVFWIFLVIFGIIIGASLLFRDMKNGFGAVTFGYVPEFELTDQFGHSFSKKDLSNRVWVGNYIASNCEEKQSCRDLVRMTASISHELENNPNVKIVSLSIDSTKSILDVLSGFDIKMNPDQDNWKLLHGNSKTIQSLVSTCIHKNIQISNPEMKLFLVDQNGIIRGYYQADRLDEIIQMVKDIYKLV